MSKKILVIGTGSIAKRHLKNIISITPKAEIFLYSYNKKRAKNLAKQFKKKIFVLKKIKKDFFTHIIIATSTSKHNQYLKSLLNNKTSIYCEKPLPFDRNFKFLTKNSTLRKIKDNVKIGYQVRFNPVIKYLVNELKKKENKKIYLIKFLCGQNLKDWRKDVNYTKLYSAGSNKFGAVYWELSHEIDLLNYIVGKPDSLYSNNFNSRNLKVKVHDISNTIFNYKKNALSCSISLEMLSPILYRKLIIITKSNYYEADLIRNIVKKSNKRKIENKNFKSNRNHIFVDFMKKFLSNKKFSNSFPYATLENGITVTNIILAMINSNKKKRLVNI